MLGMLSCPGVMYHETKDVSSFCSMIIILSAYEKYPGLDKEILIPELEPNGPGINPNSLHSPCTVSRTSKWLNSFGS